MSADLELIERIEDNLSVHYIGCDRYEVHDFGCRQGTCDCSASADIGALLARVRALIGAPARKGSEVCSCGPNDVCMSCRLGTSEKGSGVPSC